MYHYALPRGIAHGYGLRVFLILVFFADRIERISNAIQPLNLRIRSGQSITVTSPE
jgi:hypothetical protein